MSLFLSKSLGWLLDPMVISVLILIFLSIVLRLKALGFFAVIFSAFTFFPIPEMLIRNLESQFKPPDALQKAHAAVILGGDLLMFNHSTQQYTYACSFERAAEPLRLLRERRVDFIFYTGRSTDYGPFVMSESESFVQYAKEFGQPVEKIIVEGDARSTLQNALFIKKKIEEKNIQDFFLVTSATHMKRSVAVFQKAGLNPIPYPVDFLVSPDSAFDVNNFGLNRWYLLKVWLHEEVGYWYYKITGAI